MLPLLGRAEPLTSRSLTLIEYEPKDNRPQALSPKSGNHSQPERISVVYIFLTSPETLTSAGAGLAIS